MHCLYLECLCSHLYLPEFMDFQVSQHKMHIIRLHQTDFCLISFFVIVIITRLKGRVGIEWSLFDLQFIFQGRQGSSLMQKPKLTMAKFLSRGRLLWTEMGKALLVGLPEQSLLRPHPSNSITLASSEIECMVDFSSKESPNHKNPEIDL